MVGERDRHSRPTKPLELAGLAKLADAAAATAATDHADEVSIEEIDEPVEPAPDRPRTARATTLHDPLTTSLLAEVTRRSQTQEIEIIVVEDDPTPLPAKYATRRR
jgi:hypothetical protein